MGKLIISRLLRMVFTLLAVSALTFFMLELLPGDPIDLLVPPESRNNEEVVERIRAENNLDKDLVSRYFLWLGDAIRGDLGESVSQPKDTIDILKERLPITLELAIVSVLIAIIFAVPIGVWTAYRQGRGVDRTMSGLLQVGLSIPNFVVGIFLIWIFTEKWNFLDLPSTGWVRLTDSVTGNLKSVLLPAISLALVDLAVFARLMRADMISTLQENYVLSARAKGMSDRFILARHALRPSSLSVVTVVALNLGGLLGGTVVIEQLFAMGGIGRALIDGILARDFVVVQGLTVFIAAVYVLLNTAVDFVYLAIDPRIRARRH